MGLHYIHFRYYDPEIGRYVTSDPVGLKVGTNTFGYANAKTGKYSDVTGLDFAIGELQGSE